MLKKAIAYLVSAGLGAGAATVVLTTSPSKGKYQVHAVDVRLRGEAPTDGGVRPVTVTAYASKALPDGGRKDVGGSLCPIGGYPASPGSKNKVTDYEVLGSALLSVTEACIQE